MDRHQGKDHGHEEDVYEGNETDQGRKDPQAKGLAWVVFDP